MVMPIHHPATRFFQVDSRSVGMLNSCFLRAKMVIEPTIRQIRQVLKAIRDPP